MATSAVTHGRKTHTCSDLLNMFFELVKWMRENERVFPPVYFAWMLGDEFGWRHAMSVASKDTLRDYDLEALQRTLPPLVLKANNSRRWNYSLPLEDFTWFYYFYRNRHAIPSHLMKKPFYNIIYRFRRLPMATTLQALKEAVFRRRHQNAVIEISAKQLPDSFLDQYKGCVFKNRDIDFVETEETENTVFVEPPSGITHIPDGVSFMIRDSDSRQIIGGRICNAIPREVRPLVKNLMLQVLKTKKPTVRGAARRSYCSYMTSFGATKNSEKGDIGSINYIVSAPNKRAKMGNKRHRKTTDDLAHKYGFSVLQDIIIMAFLRHFPEGILDFLEKASTGTGSPYVPIDEGDFQKQIGPLMWTLYVTMNYMNRMHIDNNDRSEFTLAMVSNTNYENRGGEFNFLSHGYSFRQCNGDIFCFRGKKLHGTSWRECPQEHVLVGALVVGAAVANIVNRLYGGV